MFEGSRLVDGDVGGVILVFGVCVDEFGGKCIVLVIVVRVGWGRRGRKIVVVEINMFERRVGRFVG